MCHYYISTINLVRSFTQPKKFRMIRSHVELDRTPGTLEETSTFQTASAVSPVICSEGSGKMQGNEVDGASLCSSPSSFRVRLKNTFLDFKEEADMLRIEVESTRSRAPSADFLVHSPLRRSQSDVTGVDDNIRLRLGSNAGIADDTIELDGESFSPAGRLSPMSCLASRSRGCGEKPVSILSFSPPTFRSSPFSDAGNNKCTDFVMIMEEDPQVPSRSRISELSLLADPSCHSTQPNTPTVCISAGPAGDTGIDERTTVMLRNIPNKYTQRMLLTEVNSLGFEGQYDFFYLPIDYRYAPRRNLFYSQL